MSFMYRKYVLLDYDFTFPKNIRKDLI